MATLPFRQISFQVTFSLPPMTSSGETVTALDAKQFLIDAICDAIDNRALDDLLSKIPQRSIRVIQIDENKPLPRERRTLPDASESPSSLASRILDQIYPIPDKENKHRDQYLLLWRLIAELDRRYPRGRPVRKTDKKESSHA